MPASVLPQRNHMSYSFPPSPGLVLTCLTCLQWSCFFIRGGGSCHLIKASSTLQEKVNKVSSLLGKASAEIPCWVWLLVTAGFVPSCVCPHLYNCHSPVEAACCSPVLLMPPCAVEVPAALQPTARAAAARGVVLQGLKRLHGAKRRRLHSGKATSAWDSKAGHSRQKRSLVTQQIAEWMPSSLSLPEVQGPNTSVPCTPSGMRHGSTSLLDAQLQLPNH